jgi:site-specific DNA-cytosine methylase
LGFDLYAGAGGFSLGFKQAESHVIAANEYDVDAAHTSALHPSIKETFPR